jgi:folate-dependent phosphoribosylglycinamide formyltransferase PurN
LSTKACVDSPSPTLDRLPTCDLGRPIRVVLFGGAFFESAALEFIARLDEHPEVECLGGFCQSTGFGLRHLIADIVRRRKLLAPAVLGIYSAQAALRFTRQPAVAVRRRRRVRDALTRMVAVPDIHAPAILQRVRTLAPDIGLVYGSPILRPELFEIPTLGTLGIHHGKLPAYRGKKLTFWAMLNGEATTGVTIQRINRGIDTGEVVCAGEVPVGGRRYGRVEADVQQLGVDLYMSAVLAVKRGKASPVPQPDGPPSPLYRQPTAGDVIRLWSRQAVPAFLRPLLRP